MSEDEQRLRDAEALNLLTNRILMDYLSLQIDAGQASLDAVKQLIGVSATEVRFFEKVLVDRFDFTFADR